MNTIVDQMLWIVDSHAAFTDDWLFLPGEEKWSSTYVKEGSKP